jgi:hypothetical protein
MLTYLPAYSVLVCKEHQRALYGVDEHLKRHHKLSLRERRELLSAYSSLSLLSPAQVPLPEPYRTPLPELGPPEDALVCCCQKSSSSSTSTSTSTSTSSSTSSTSSSSSSSEKLYTVCGFISTSRSWMQQHVNKQHQIQLTRWSTSSAASYAEHATQLWKPVQVQTFFQEKRYRRYFLVQEPEQPPPPPLLPPLLLEQRDASQTSQRRRQEKAEQDRAESYQQRLACLSYQWDAVEQKDSKAIERIAEEVSAKDCTGWFKRTQWDKHLQAYPDWRLLSYAIRLPGADEPQLQRVVQLVEELVEEAVQGLSTLSIDTLRWLRSPRPKEPDVRPFSRMQNKASQLRAARLWARLLCYCLRVVAIDPELTAPGLPENQPLPPAAVPELASIARLFPWHSKQKLAAERL